MTEVAEGYVQYFNPSSPEDCLSSIVKYLNNKELKKAQDKASRYVPVSWDVTYKQVEGALLNLTKKNKNE
jgi:hypothetical protein